MGGLVPQPVVDIRDALVVALIRNECREFMTHSSSYITVSGQIGWFLNKPKSWQLFLYFWGTPQVPVGFGLRRTASLPGIGYYEEGLREVSVVSGGLAQGWRGQGLGKSLFEHLSSLCVETWLDVFSSNTPALKLYKSLGFEQVRNLDGIILMRRVRC